MIETVESLKEKECVKKLCGDLAITVLWMPEIFAAHGEANEHDISVEKNDGVVKVIIKRKI